MAEKKNKEKIVVEKINLKIGEFTCVEPISLINTFNAAVFGSWLDSSEIIIETIPFEGRCSKCKNSYYPKKDNGYKSPFDNIISSNLNICFYLFCKSWKIWWF